MQYNTKIYSNASYFAEVVRLLAAQKKVKITVKGQSMEPFLKTGDVVALKPYDKTTIQIGEIVLGKYDGRFMLHRVQEIKDWGIRMMGDGNNSRIEDVPHEEVYGVVFEAYRGDKNLGICSSKSLLFAKFWYKAKFIRRIFFKFKRFNHTAK